MPEQLDMQDWGDFSSVIDELEREESTAVVDSDLSAANDEPAAPDKSEAVAGMLSVAFVLTEQATSAISNVNFAFDEKGKQAVIEAAQPVFAKHGNAIMAFFGNYIEEATLVIAVISLAFTSKRHVKALQLEKTGGEDEEKESVQPTQSD
ncbi:hypothetical protein [Vibrio hyugaensis]|uniref:hypothetical protein n=1 Tax=Vibrio hyugaensis TaxID=1534743 RepID=UPI0005EE8DD5|nr:hypothetical protein [Vibrio hyugaensis]